MPHTCKPVSETPKASTWRSPLSRAESYIIITIIYILAFLTGLLTYDSVSGDLWLRLLLADVAATVLTFIGSLVLHNASVYDPYWSVQPAVILVCLIGDALTLSEGVLLLAVLLWATRLTANWAYAFRDLRHQDWRYTMLHEQTGRAYVLVNFVGIHMVPTLVVYACTLPAVYVMQADAPFTSLSLIGFGLCLLAVTLQTVSDIQMHRYRKTRSTPFIRTGLWTYSRHPNYLGEILMWWGVCAYTVATLGVRWYFFFGAVLNTALFLFVSIPMAERRQAKKAGYDAYRAATRALLPLPKHHIE